MPEMVLFIASNVVGETSFWIRLTSSGSISCIKSERTDFLSADSRLNSNPSKEESEAGEARIRVLIFLEFAVIVARRGWEKGKEIEKDGGV